MHTRNLLRNGRFFLALFLALGMWLLMQPSPARLAAADHPAPPPPAGDPLGLPPAADFNLPAPSRDAPPNILVERALQEQMAADETTGYLIYFREQADLSPAYAMDWEARGEFVLKTLQETAARTQADVRAYLEAQGADYQAFWVDNVIVVASANRRTFDGLLAFDAIQALGAQRVLHLDEPVAPPVNAPAAPTAVEPNISHVQAPAAWGLGYQGAGVVVANIDSGVRNTHAALVQQYRGTSTGSHDYNWLGVAGGSATPNDDDGHGTHTMGTMVGADAGQVNQIGMAPGAQWIACDACEGGSCSIANLLTCGQWIVAPYPVGDPTSPDAGKRPHIVNNSWSGCENLYDNGYAGTITAWHAAGIYPIFSNGNAGNCGYPEPPGLNTVGNPARSGNVTGVGSTGQSDGQYAPHSNWGPTDHADTVNPRGYPYIKPQVVAPGVDIRSSTAGSDTAYQVQTGTSMAAPHVAGLVALMWEAGPCLIGDYAATETLLEQTANPIPYATGNGDEGPGNVPNHATGWGEIDAPAAVQAAAAYCHISGYGVLDGTITEDGTGTPIAGALVAAGNATRTLTLVTDAAGFYSDTLPSETYTLTVSAYGYAPTTLGGVTVISGATTTRDFVLTVAPKQILRVTPAGTTAWPCGYDSGWSNPCTLKTALAHATAGGEVWVAAGVYKPTNSTTDQEAYINIPAGVAVYGGFAGTETALEQRDPAANVTIFSGDIDNNDSQTPVVTDAFTVIGTDTNSYHVVAGATNDVTLDGVTITGGYGYYDCPHGWNAQYGGGLYTQGTMTLNNVVFSGNRSFYGGGIRTTARLTITNSTFTGNYAESSGGGISNGGIGTTLSNVTFTDNRTDNGGGGAANNTTYSGEPDGSMILENVTFSDNHALNGGGLYVKGAAALTDVTFNHNSATNLGNAMTIVDASALVTLNRVTFVNNYGEAGGALSSWSGHAILDSVTFYGNTSKSSGGAMDVSSGGRWELNNVLITGNSSDSGGGGIVTGSPMTLTNVTLVNNTANSTGSGIYNTGTSIVIRNSIIWGNTIAGGATISYSDVQGGWAGDGNLDADPVLAPLGDYGGGILSRAILTGSPAIDAGDPATCLATDMRGMARSSPCDMGAFELTLAGVVPTITLVSAPNPVAYGAPVTFTATVTAAGSTPGGAVQFTADGVPLGSPVTLLGDHASISTSSLSVGTRAIAATYTGDVSHTLATTQIQQTVSCLPAVSVTNANDDGAGSLRAAFAPLCAGGTITFDGDYTIVLADPLTVDKSMTIDGAGRRITLSGNHATRIFNIMGGNVILDHLTLADGQGLYNCGLWSDYCGGAIWMENSNVVLQNSTIVSSSAESRGGGIFNYEATLTVQNSTLSGNAAGYAGGGIFSYFGTLNVANSTFSGNTAPDPSGGGGAIYNIGHLYFPLFFVNIVSIL